MSRPLLQLAWGGLHPDRVRQLLAETGTPARALARLAAGDGGAGSDIQEAIAVPAAAREVELKALDIAFLTPEDAGYPAYLADEPQRPPFLFMRGRLPVRPGVAIVGTRRSTSYGRRIAYAYGWGLAEAGIPVISGLARGIDAAAHRGVVDAGGSGVAVMGCGLDRVYPREHSDLLNRLEDLGGAAVSEYPPGVAPQPWRFPPRNRIIVLLAAAVVVVEANQTGGALITARHALTHGREVFATPGDITRAASAGTNSLIRDGAIPVFDADDLLAALSLMPAFAGSLIDGDKTGTASLLDRIDRNGVSVSELASSYPGSAEELDQNLARLAESGAIVRTGDTVLRVSPRFGTL